MLLKKSFLVKNFLNFCQKNNTIDAKWQRKFNADLESPAFFSDQCQLKSRKQTPLQLQAFLAYYLSVYLYICLPGSQ